MTHSYSSDGKSTRLAASGTVFAGPARIRYMHWLEGAVGGTIEIRDGSVSGTILVQIDTAGNSSTDSISLSDVPIRCENGAYITFDDAAAVTVFYN